MAKFEGRVREEVGYRDFPAYSNWTNAQGVPEPLSGKDYGMDYGKPCITLSFVQESTKQLTMQKLPVVASFHLKRLASLLVKFFRRNEATFSTFCSSIFH